MFVACPATGQEGPDEDAPLATLPQSNEALVLSNRVEQAIEGGDYRLAIELIDEIRSLPGKLVAAPASRTYYPVWRQALLLLGQLPPPGVDLYRRLHDAEVAARLSAARTASDVDELLTLFRVHGVSESWPAIGDELAAQLIDRGRFGQAIEVLQEMKSARRGDSAVREMQMVIALARVGAWGSARRLLDRLDAEERSGPEDQQRFQRLMGWLSSIRARPPADDARPNAYALRGAPAWSDRYGAAAGDDWADADYELAEAVDHTHRLPLCAPVVAEGTLVFRMRGSVWAFDALTLTQRWRARELIPEGMRVELPGERGTFGPDEPALSVHARLLLANHLRHTLVVGGGRVYTVETLTLFEGDNGLHPQPFTLHRQTVQRNELIARDLETGRIVWRSGEDPAHPLFDVEFQDRPLLFGQRLVAPIRRNDDLHLVELAAADGALLREIPIVGPPTHFTREGGRCLISADETSIYVCTGNGVLAAVGRDDLDWKWATVYPSTVAEHLGRLWWKPPVTPRESGIDRPVLADDLLIVAPVDSLDIIALDRFGGRPRWRIPRRDFSFVVGAIPGGLIVGGSGLTCLDLEDPTGRAVRWKSVPLEISGRPAVYRDRIYAPTRQGLVVLDGRSGKVLDDQIEDEPLDRRAASQSESAADLPGLSTLSGVVEAASVSVTDQAVFAVSPTRVVKYPAPRAVRENCAALLSDEPQNARALLALAWLDALAGDYELARRRLQPLDSAPPAQAAAREQLLAHVYLALAGRTDAPDERLVWLRRAAELTDRPEIAARLAVLIGRALEDQRDWLSALRHYGQMLNETEPRYVGRGEGGQAAVWLDAVERIGGLAHDAAGGATGPDASDVGRFVHSFVNDESSTNVGLMRLRLALADGALRTAVDRKLLTGKLAPEIAQRFLSAAIVDRDTPIEQRRELHLARWETLVALDRLEEARAADELWQRELDPGAGRASEDVIDRVDGIRKAYAKLEAARGGAFDDDLHRQWRVKHTELLVDPRRAEAGSHRWLLLRDLERREIQLVNVFRNDHARRKTTDALIDTNQVYQAASDEYERMLSGQRLGWQETRRLFWPVARYDSLAAVPVRGGLVAVGLGPERAAGRRLWELAVPDWNAIPMDFGAMAAATEHGLCFAPRSDRIAMVGWADGALWWQRDLSGLTIRRLIPAGDVIVIESDDRRVWVIDTVYGRRPRALPVDTESLLGVEVIDETIVAWGRAFVAGFDAVSLERRWSRPLEQLGPLSAPVAMRPWLALRRGGAGLWRVLDARSGDPVFDASIAGFDRITAIAGDRDALFVAGTSGVAEHADKDEMRLARFDAESGQRLWLTGLDTRVDINVSQLLAHERYIPVLLHRERDEAETGAPDGAPEIQLVAKLDGGVSDPYSLEGDYQPDSAACDMYLLATPTRIIVQVDGNTIAYGRSKLLREP